MNIFGDIHGDFEYYLNKISDLGCSVQIGDYGVGFHPHVDALLNHDNPKHKAIAGNHDDRRILKEFDCYLGDYGYLPDQDIFFLGGAFGPWFDTSNRVYNLSWFPTEQLDGSQLEKAYQLFIEVKPKYVITHTAPASICNRICKLQSGVYMGNLTEHMLEFMFRAHEPLKWYFGHWHCNFVTKIGRTHFQCVNINEVIRDDELGEW